MARLGVRSLRRATLVSGAMDLAVASLGAVLVALALRRCGWREKAPATAAAAMAAVKIASMVWAGIAQRAAAAAIARRFGADPLLSEDDDFRRLRKGGIPPLDAGFQPGIFTALPLIRSPVLLRSMGDLGAGRGTVPSKLTTLRWTSMFLGFCNLVLFLSGAVLLVSLPSGCSGADRLALVFVALVAVVRIAYMVAAGRAQQATAETIVSNVLETSVDADALIRHERRVRLRFPILILIISIKKQKIKQRIGSIN
ncbi:hypothetical protein BHE74_00016235 [Ensete ventricosum]|nr:hypothetical protein BHE74_00016235 [Ensete ventricosum]